MNKYYYFVLSSFFLINNSFAVVRPLETTRLMASGGAGIGSILVIESSFLNPAPIAFYTDSVMYYQNTKAKVEGDDQGLRDYNYGDAQDEAFVVADTSSILKGTFSYLKQSENSYKRDRFTSSMAAPIGQSTSLGFLYKYTHDKDESNSHKYFSELTMGMTHIISDSTIVGLVINDLFLHDKNNEYYMAVGLQQAIFNNFALLVDYGQNTHAKSNRNTFSRYGLQINLFADFYVKLGQFFDTYRNLKGQAWGVIWSGPKLDLFYAYKKSEQLKNDNLFLFSDEELIEHSLALSLRF